METMVQRVGGGGGRPRKRAGDRGAHHRGICVPSSTLENCASPPDRIIYRNNDTAQYNNNIAIIIFNTFPCLLNNILNIEPNNAQHIVPVNPTNANKNAKNTNIRTA
jgi:hypothetical protein